MLCMFSERKWIGMTAAPWNLKYADYSLHHQDNSLATEHSEMVNSSPDNA